MLVFFELSNADRSPAGLGQYNSLGEYCDPHTPSSVFLILIAIMILLIKKLSGTLMYCVINL